ncbi:MAG: DUF5350 domain-containing protein [Methanospirillum sp.]|nr:DUF5350 domain-containing protein [Methanospirillum sp.]
MGKTGTTEWMQVKGSKGQIRLVPRKESQAKKPGPNQRFKAQTTIKRMERAAGRGGGRGRGGDQRGGGRGGSSGGRGGRGGSRGGQTPALRSMAARRRMGRPKVSMLGPKQRSK